MTDIPDTPTVPDDLVQAVHDALGINIEAHEDSTLVMTLAAVPDGWAKIDGEWRRLTPLVMQLVRGNVTEANQ